MEDDAVRSSSLFQSLDGESFFVGFRIASADEDYATGRTWVHHQCFLVQIACRCGFKQFDEVALDAEHHAFCFGVAHADVVFDNHRFAFHADKSEEDKAFVSDVFFFQTIDGRFDDACTYLFHVCRVSKRDRSYATHSACVEPFVSFTDAFVVFGYGKYFVVLTVRQYEYRTLDTAQELFNHNGCRCGTEHAAEHFFQFFLCFIQRRKDENAFPGTKAISLQYVGSFQRFEESEALFEVFGSDAFVAGCRDVVAHHEAFGKFLASFQLRSFCRWTDNSDVFQLGTFLEIVVDAFYQRVFGTYHYHFDVFFQGESADSFKISCFDVDILAYGSCSGISRGNV